MIEHEIYIHVGHRKTATTWLQNQVFNLKNERLNYLGKTSREYPNWLLSWHYLDAFEFSNKKTEIAKDIQSRIDKDRVNLISSEAFTNTGVIHEQAHRIKQIIPNAKIIFVTRDPIELVLSHYRNDIQMGDAYCDIDEYLDWERTPMVIGKRKSIYLPDFFFIESLDLYKKLFGDANVLLLEYEELEIKPINFIGKIEEFMGIEFNLNNKVFEKKENSSRFDATLRDKLRSNLEIKIANCISNRSNLLNRSTVENSLVEDELIEKLKCYFREKANGSS